MIAWLLVAAISWGTVGEKLAAFLDAHPHCKPAELTSAYKAENVSLDALPLGNSTWLVAGSYTKNGTFFVLAPDAHGRYRVVWNIKSVAEPHLAKRDEIGKWAWTGSAWGDGPLLPAIGRVRASRSGHARFFVDATSDADAGGTYAKQISVWEWNGKEAVPLFIKTYFVSFDTGGDDLRPELLTLHTKGSFKTFFTCGACVEPEMIWRIEITPDGVRDLGAKDMIPAYRKFDELVDAIVHDRNTAKLASTTAVKAIREKVQDDEHYPLGMVTDIQFEDGVLQIDDLRLRLKDGYFSGR